MLERLANSLPKMEPFLKAMKNVNPGFHYLLDIQPDTNVFQGVYILLPFVKGLLDHGYLQKVFGLDGAHMKDILLQTTSTDRIFLRK